MKSWWVAASVSLAILCGCPSDNKPDGGTPPPVDTGMTGGDAAMEDVPAAKDAEVFVIHDAGGPISCGVSCDCPQGLGCVSGECRRLGTPVYCCDKQGCPMGQQCLDGQNQPDVCEGDPPPNDAGVGDIGPGNVGDFCENDMQCDQAQSLACWTRFEDPFLFWGYCTKENCGVDGICPTGSECFQFGNPPNITGCLLGCNDDTGCRSDAHCLILNDPNIPFLGVCIPDCRDDFFDCTPRNGTRYCDPNSGVFIPDCAFTPTNDPAAEVGDPCVNTTDCAVGDICLGETGWRFDDGMCSHVCAGLPEATPCPLGSTCQMLPPPNNAVGLCFDDCVGGTCPDRPGALCDTLDPSWFTPQCIPPQLP